jgi:hypothetical protein
MAVPFVVDRLLDVLSSIVTTASPNRRFEFHKRSQLFIRTDNEPLTVAAMRVGNKDHSPVGIHG